METDPKRDEIWGGHGHVLASSIILGKGMEWEEDGDEVGV